mgnify:CR=1 FL=1
MSLKEEVDAMLHTVNRVKWSRHGYGSNEVIAKLSAYIRELEGKLAAPAARAPAKKAPAKKKSTYKK